jgi:hypothetical protein
MNDMKPACVTDHGERKMKIPSLAVAVAVSMFGYVGQTLAAGAVADATEAQVADCTFVRDVNGRAIWGERLKEQGTTRAKEDARAQAAKAGATHVVWGEISSTDVTTAAGKAYRCAK